MFADFGKLGDAVVDLLDPADSLTLVAGLKSIVITWVTLYFMYMGFMVLLGKLDNPVRHIIYKTAFFGFLGLFAFNINGWFDLAINAVNGLSTWISGGGTQAIYNLLDDGIITINKLSNIYFDHDSWKWLKLLALFGTLIIFIGYLAVSLTTAILLVVNNVTLKLVIILAPFAFVSLFFPRIRGIFDRWLEMVISNIFTIFFIALFSKVIFKKYKGILDGIDPTSSVGGFLYNVTKVEIFTSAFTVFAFSALAVVLLFMATQLASKLSSVSIESIPKSGVMTAFIASYAVSKGTSGMYKAGKSVAGKSISGVSRASSFIGNGGSKTHSLLKKQGKLARAEREKGNSGASGIKNK